MAMDMRTNASAAASRIIRAWNNLPPGMRAGDESQPTPGWQGSSVAEIYEAVDVEELDRAMRETILDDAYAPGLTDDQAEELTAGDYYSLVSAELNWDSARLEFRLTSAPEKFSVTVRNPFVD